MYKLGGNAECHLWVDSWLTIITEFQNGKGKLSADSVEKLNEYNGSSIFEERFF
jgi:hypothetical protein